MDVKVLFRTNASPQVGFGHLTRCRALAMALRLEGIKCILVGPDPAYARSEDFDVFSHWFHVDEWISTEKDASYLISLAKYHQSQWLVLDDYRIDYAYQLAIRAAGLRWLQFDGTATKPLWGDIIVNTNPIVKDEDYSGLLYNPNTKLLLGPIYSILRPEFENVYLREAGRPVKKILVMFGGGDDRGAIEFVLSTLLSISTLNQHFVVISGSENPNNSNLGDWINKYGKGRVALHIDPENVSVLFSCCDLAIMAGGSSIYEACVHGIPMVVISIAENQVLHSQAWQQLGCLTYLGRISQVHSSSLSNSVHAISINESVRRKMSIACSKAVTGKGAKLVAALLSHEHIL